MKSNLMAKVFSGFLVVCMVYAIFPQDTVIASESFPPVSLPIEKTVSTISTGGQHSLAVKADGSLWSWGWGNFGELGTGKSGDAALFSAPTKIMDDVSYTVASISSSYAVEADGTLWAWGNNQDGQLGDGTTENRARPVKIMDNIAAIKPSNVGTVLALKADGSLWAWGNNQNGQMGDGTTVNRNKPVKIMDNVASFAVHSWYAMAIQSDGALWAWGVNANGQLGDDSQTNQLRPVKVMDAVISIALDMYIARSIRTDGSLWEWGGFLVSPNYSNREIIEPRKVMNNIAFLADANYAIDHNSVYWSLSFYVDNQKHPHQRIIDQVVTASNSGAGHVVIRDDGSLWWAKSAMLWRDEMQQIMNSVVSCSKDTSASNHLLMLKDDGSLWGMGQNNVRQLGVDPPIQQIVEPVKIMDGVKLPTAAPSAPALTATPTNATVLINGENVAFDAYNIGDNNYFKLRDLAYILSGTEKQFEVGWDSANNAILLASGKAYMASGGEMTGKGAGSKTPTLTSAKIFLDGREITFTAYNIENYNYFKLRDIGQAFDFCIEWDGANNTIVIDTGRSYTVE